MATKYIVAARIDENGNITGGSSGDQSGDEVMVQTLSSSGTWNTILRPPVNGANTIVKQAYAAAANDNIGYDQNQRTTLYTQAKACNWDLSAITTKCECDCSALVAVLANCAGYSVDPSMSTYSEVSALTAVGFTKYTYSEASLTPGDVLLRSGHTGTYVGTSSTYTGSTSSDSSSKTSTNAIDCVFTTSTESYNEWIVKGYTDEGIMFYSAGNIPVYELLNPYSNTHLYTTSENEYNSCINNGWTGKGIAFYCVYDTNNYEDDPDSDTVYASDDNYALLLQSEGYATLNEHSLINSFDAEVENNYTFVYKKDYDIGDVVDIESPYHSLLGQARVTETVISYDTDGYRIYCNYEMISNDTMDSDSSWVHRMYNANTGAHYYTLSAYTYNLRLDEGWSDEGEHWQPPTEGYRVYSLYSKIKHDQILTTDEEEYKTLKEEYTETETTDDNGNVTKTKELTWEDEGMVFYSDGDNPIYRMYNPNGDQHFFTTSKTEYDSLEFKGWTKEGIGFYAEAI